MRGYESRLEVDDGLGGRQEVDEGLGGRQEVAGVQDQARR